MVTRPEARVVTHQELWELCKRRVGEYMKLRHDEMDRMIRALPLEEPFEPRGLLPVSSPIKQVSLKDLDVLYPGAQQQTAYDERPQFDPSMIPSQDTTTECLYCESRLPMSWKEYGCCNKCFSTMMRTPVSEGDDLLLDLFVARSVRQGANLQAVSRKHKIFRYRTRFGSSFEKTGAVFNISGCRARNICLEVVRYLEHQKRNLKLYGHVSMDVQRYASYVRSCL